MSNPRNDAPDNDTGDDAAFLERELDLAARGIPAACEVDIYGAVSEYMAQIAAGI